MLYYDDTVSRDITIFCDYTNCQTPLVIRLMYLLMSHVNERNFIDANYFSLRAGSGDLIRRDRINGAFNPSASEHNAFFITSCSGNVIKKMPVQCVRYGVASFFRHHFSVKRLQNLLGKITLISPHYQRCWSSAANVAVSSVYENSDIMDR